MYFQKLKYFFAQLERITSSIVVHQSFFWLANKRKVYFPPPTGKAFVHQGYDSAENQETTSFFKLIFFCCKKFPKIIFVSGHPVIGG